MVEPETHCYGWRQTKRQDKTTGQLVNNIGIPKPRGFQARPTIIKGYILESLINVLEEIEKSTQN